MAMNFPTTIDTIPTPKAGREPNIWLVMESDFSQTNPTHIGDLGRLPAHSAVEALGRACSHWPKLGGITVLMDCGDRRSPLGKFRVAETDQVEATAERYLQLTAPDAHRRARAAEAEVERLRRCNNRLTCELRDFDCSLNAFRRYQRSVRCAQSNLCNQVLLLQALVEVVDHPRLRATLCHELKALPLLLDGLPDPDAAESVTDGCDEPPF